MRESGEIFLDFEVKLRQGDFVLEATGQFSDGITAIFGPSGAGKSTLLACLSGMLRPDSGHIRMAGESLFSSNEDIRRVSQSLRSVMVFQDGMLFPHMTVRENILYGYRLTPVDHRVIDPDELCDFLGIGGMMNRYPATLSGGERQRVALARSVATSPRLLLLDEPVASLDIRLRNEVVTYLKRVHERYGIPMIYVSHSLSDVMALAPNALALENGRVKSYGPVVDLVAEVASSTRVGRDDIDNLFVGTVQDSGAIEIGGVDVIAQAGDYRPKDRVTVSISASDIILALERPEAISARNILRGIVRSVELGDYAAFAFVDAGAEFVVELTSEAVAALGVRDGSEVYVIFKTSSITITAG